MWVIALTTLGSMASRCMFSQHSSARRSCPHLMQTFMSAECVCTLRGTLRFCMSADSCSARSSCSSRGGQKAQRTFYGSTVLQQAGPLLQEDPALSKLAPRTPAQGLL